MAMGTAEGWAAMGAKSTATLADLEAMAETGIGADLAAMGAMGAKSTPAGAPHPCHVRVLQVGRRGPCRLNVLG